MSAKKYQRRWGHIRKLDSGRFQASFIGPDMRRYNGPVKHHLDTFVGDDPEALLFDSRGKCGHLSQNVFREALISACKSIGKQGVTHHAFRHLGATLATRAGGSLAEVQARLGHSTVRAAMIYQHAVSGRDSDIAAALSVIAETG